MAEPLRVLCSDSEHEPLSVSYMKQTSYMSDDDEVDPETILEEKHLHIIFKRANLSPEKAVQLGLHLGVEKQDITVVQTVYSNDPVQQAVEICSRWKRGLKESDLNMAVKKLNKALKEIKRKRAAKMLVSRYGRERHSTFIGLREHEIWDKVSNLNKLQAIKLGLNLSIQKNRIDAILDKEKEPGIGALVLVLEWKSDLERSGDLQCRIFNNALEEAKQNPYKEDDWLIIPHNYKISREQVRSVNKIGFASETKELEMHGVNHLEEVGTAEELGFQGYGCLSHSNKSESSSALLVIKGLKVSKKEILCLGLLASLILCLGLLSFGFMIPSYQYKYMTTPICKGDVIAIPIPTWTPPFIDLELIGPISNCTASIMATPNIEYDVEKLSHSSLDHMYLAEGSTITILPEDVISKTSVYVWLFPNYKSVYQAEKDGFDHVKDKDKYDCDDPNGDALCGRISKLSDDPLIIHVKKSAYYFMRCVDHPDYNCSSLKQWNYTCATYSFNSARNRSDLIHSNAGSSRLPLRHAYFESATKWKTVLAKLSDGCNETCYSYFIISSYITHFQEIGLYLVIGLIVVLIIITVCSILLYISNNLLCKHRSLS